MSSYLDVVELGLIGQPVHGGITAGDVECTTNLKREGAWPMTSHSSVREGTLASSKHKENQEMQKMQKIQKIQKIHESVRIPMCLIQVLLRHIPGNSTSLTHHSGLLTAAAVCVL
ncbi:hypothetical protein E4U21_007004 [Claviceps maximensis]|nr:hypothetical protein E4U21_007004 [Claviceps maximensis]